MGGRILIDTSIWIEYFKGNKSYTNFIDENLDLDNIYIVGPIISELLHGVKSKSEHDILSGAIEAVPFLNCTYADWVKAGKILFELKKTGISIPLTDAIIGSIALRMDASVLTLDSHFKKIKDLKILEI